jgi:hypothetical protein
MELEGISTKDVYTKTYFMDFDFQQLFTKLWMHELKTDFAKSL